MLFTAVFTTIHYWLLSWARRNHLQLASIYLIYILILSSFFMPSFKFIEKTLPYYHVREVCVTNNDGFWIRWLDLLALLLQLQPITTAQNQWLLRTRSIPSLITSVFSSTATNTEQRITVHWIIEFLLNPLRVNHDFFITSRLPEYRSPARIISCYSPVATEMCHC
jgi:hypothetical protein